MREEWWCCCLAAWLASCSFPDLDITVMGGSAAMGAGGEDGGATASTGASNAGGGGFAGTGAEQPSAGGFTGGGGEDPCDMDHDDAPAEGCGGGAVDCNDQDNRVHPGQTGFFVEPNTMGNYDYDCINGEEKKWPQGSCMVDLTACVPISDVEVFDPDGNFECGVWGTVHYCAGTAECAAYPAQQLPCR